MLKFILFLIAFLPFLILNAQQVTNMKVTQEGDNVVITYDISSDKTEQTFDIKVECSADGGKTFSILPKSLTGDLKGITAGTANRIVWDVLSERQELTGDQFVFQLVLVENYANYSGAFTDDRDGHVYKWVKIGKQIWMAENLAYLPTVSPATESSGTNPFYYVYKYTGTTVYEAKTTDIYKTYGVLYNWTAAKEACPQGWHLPSDSEWDGLVSSLGGESIVGGKLKETGLSNWHVPNNGSTNESGFNALPGGYYFLDGTFNNIGYEGYWWSSTEKNTDVVWVRKLYHNYKSISRFEFSKVDGFSVRCIKN